MNVLNSNSIELFDAQLARELQEQYDSEVAAQLQNQIEEETNNDAANVPGRTKEQNTRSSLTTGTYSGFLASDISPVDPSLENSDPNPDIRVLFLQYNTQFFWGQLSGIEVKWSPRMTLCAGLCVYEGHGGLCSVRLSQPLLKLRPRKDLVETLLHEMIHAYLFVTDNDRDHDGHGLQFQGHMRRINKATGANISIYHTFHDEVESYQQHWWRCDGPCQSRRPFFGYVKRAMNRAPSSNDFWWAEHKSTCGGTYTKVKEPEGYGQKKGGKKDQGDKTKNKSKDIRTFGGKGNVLGSAPSKTSSSHNSNMPTVGSSRNPATIHNLNNNRTSNSSAPSTSTNSQSSMIVNGVLLKKTGNTTNSLFSEIQSTKVLSAVSDKSSASVDKYSRPGTSRTGAGFEPMDDDDDLWATDINNIEAAPLSSLLKGKGLKTKMESEKNAKNVLGASFKKEEKDVFKDGRKKSGFSFRSKGRNKKPSVCKGAEFYEDRPKFKRKKKYILDELDTNDNLWDSSNHSSVMKNSIKSEFDVSHLKAKLKKECCVKDEEQKAIPQFNTSNIKSEKSPSSHKGISSYFSTTSQRHRGSNGNAAHVPDSGRRDYHSGKQIKEEPSGSVNENKNDFGVSSRKKKLDESLYQDIVDLSDFDDDEFDFVPPKRNVIDRKHVKSEKLSSSQKSIGSFFSSSGSKQSNKRKSIFSSANKSSTSTSDPNVSSSSSCRNEDVADELPDIYDSEDDDFKTNRYQKSSDDSLSCDIVDISDDDDSSVHRRMSFNNKSSRTDKKSKKSPSVANIRNYFSTPSCSSTDKNKNGLIRSASDRRMNGKLRGDSVKVNDYFDLCDDDDDDDDFTKGSVCSKKRSSNEAFGNDDQDSLEEDEGERENGDSNGLPFKRSRNSAIVDSSCESDNSETEEQNNESVEEDNNMDESDNKVSCPVCGLRLAHTDINSHLDSCLR